MIESPSYLAGIQLFDGAEAEYRTVGMDDDGMIADRLPAIVNVLISNVPGPKQPLYCAGTRMTHYFPVSIPSNGSVLNITVQSYLDQLDFGLIACRNAVLSSLSIGILRIV